ncbi:helix-turn-helix domain-containing protein [Aquipuribacter nitratireducens]|uniref:Helix-turn-helix domain-containing protein n=1 Tax=Aquipuribacter nitratireducens TaxID=650104 RepID=A0ABW0GPJ8_9MICO
MASLGARLRAERTRAGLSLREVARQLRVSPSFVSQLENGKSQPSVATLYSLSQLLDVSIDVLFEPDPVQPVEPTPAGEPAEPEGAGADSAKASRDPAPSVAAVLRRSSAAAARRAPRTPSDDGDRLDDEVGEQWFGRPSGARWSVTSPGRRPRLVMDSGVIWEQLARTTDHTFDFLEIEYPPGASSTTDERMLRHLGFEYGYLLEGELQVTAGFDVFVLRAGDALGLDSSLPHLFTNTGSVPARGIWFVHHQHH